MIYVRVELWPHGQQGKSRVLGEATIANVGGTATHGDYLAWLSKFQGFENVAAPKPSEVWKRARVTGFPRRSQGPWDLLYRLLDVAVGKRSEGGRRHG